MNKRNIIFLSGFLLLVLCGLGMFSPASAKYQQQGNPNCTALTKLEFEMWVLDWDLISVDAGKGIAEALELIGIDATVVPLTDDLFYDPIDAGGRLDEPDGVVVNVCRVFETYEMSWGYSPVPYHVYFRAHSSQDYPLGSANHGGVNETLDEALELSMTSVNPVELKAALYDVQKYSAEWLPYYPLFLSDDSHIVRTEWDGYVQLPGGIFTSFNYWSTLNMTNGGANDFIMAYPADVKYRNPLLASDGRSAFFAMQLYDTLIAYDENLEKIPWLAESWTQSTDGTQINFTIRDNVRWHDYDTSGRYVTPEDVKYSLDTVFNSSASYFVANVERIDNIEIDGQTVVCNLNSPYAWAADDIGSVYIVPKHVWQYENHTDTKWESDLTNKTLRVGSGPFKFVSGIEDDTYNLEKFDNYWYTGGTGMPEVNDGVPLPTGSYPKIETFTIKVVDEEMTRVLGMQAGTYDTERYETMSIPVVKSVINETYDQLKLVNTPSQWDYYFVWNQQIKPFDDVRVRKAMAYAMDQAQIAYFAREDWATPTYSVIPECFWPAFYNDGIEKYEYDIAKANSILEAAGYLDTDDDGVRECPGHYVNPPTTTVPTKTVTTVPTVTKTKTKEEPASGFGIIITFQGMLIILAVFHKRKRK